MAFLKEEGYSPYIDNSDNTLCFKKEGVIYWIAVGKDTPHFMTFNRSGWSFTGDNAIDRDIALKVSNDVNCKVESAKSYCSDKNVVFSVESYSRSSEDYKYVFYANMRSLDGAYNMFKTQYKSYSGNDNQDSSSSPSSYSSTGGNVVMMDDFSSDNGSWATDGAPKTMKTIDGYLYCKDYESNGWTVFSRSLPLSLTERNFQIEYSAKMINHENYSTMFFYIGESYNVSHCIGVANMASYWTVDGGTYKDMHCYVQNIKIDNYKENDFNQYIVKKINNMLYFYCNGTLVFSSEMKSLSLTQFGFFFGHKNEMWLDYIKVTTL